jgi:hypothetical protein
VKPSIDFGTEAVSTPADISDGVAPGLKGVTHRGCIFPHSLDSERTALRAETFNCAFSE